MVEVDGLVLEVLTDGFLLELLIEGTLWATLGTIKSNTLHRRSRKVMRSFNEGKLSTGA